MESTPINAEDQQGETPLDPVSNNNENNENGEPVLNPEEAQKEPNAENPENPNSPPEEGKEEEKEKVPEGPKIFYGYIPSAFMLECNQLPFINFAAYPVEVYEEIKSMQFANVPEFQNKPLNASFNHLLTEFDKHNVEQILNEPSPLIKEFTCYVKSQINSDANKLLARFWPPVLQNTDYKEIVYFLIKILHSVTDRKPILAWLSTAVYPQRFTHKRVADLIAFCQCRYKKKDFFWATLDNDHNFTLFRYQEGGYEEEVKGAAKSISVASDGSVTVTGEEGPLATFTPDEKVQSDLWKDILIREPPILNFFSAYHNPSIDQIYTTLYDTLTNADAVPLKALLITPFDKPEDGDKVFTDFFNVMTHGGKTIPFLSTVINNDVGGFETEIANIFSKPCFTVKLCDMILKKYNHSYFEGFITPLVHYIKGCRTSGLDSDKPNLPVAEKLINSIVKYICDSYALIPPQVSLILNMIRTQISLRCNQKDEVYRGLANIFFINYFVDIFKNIDKYYPNIGCEELFSAIGKLFEKIFMLGQMNGEFTSLATMTKRLERHIYPRLMKFIFTISDYTDQDPEFEIVDENSLVKSLENIVKFISKSKFLPTYNQMITDADKKTPSNIGTGFAGTLCGFFIHGDDILDVAEEKKAKSANPKRRAKVSKLIKPEAPEKEEEKKGESKGKKKKDANEIVDPSRPRRMLRKNSRRAMLG